MKLSPLHRPSWWKKARGSVAAGLRFVVNFARPRGLGVTRILLYTVVTFFIFSIDLQGEDYRHNFFVKRGGD